MKPPARRAAFVRVDLPAEVISDELALAALPTAVGLTRLFTVTYLRKWRLDAITYTAEVVVSEIVTNAVKATGLTEQPADYTQLHDADTGQVITRLCWPGPSLVIETWDDDRRPPVLSSPSGLDESGRGLMLVTALTNAWGHYPSGTGKVVGAQIPLPPATTAAAHLYR